MKEIQAFRVHIPLIFDKEVLDKGVLDKEKLDNVIVEEAFNIAVIEETVIVIAQDTFESEEVIEIMRQKIETEEFKIPPEARIDDKNGCLDIYAFPILNKEEFDQLRDKPIFYASDDITIHDVERLFSSSTSTYKQNHSENNAPKQYIPKCPTCGSPDIQKISAIKKAGGFFAVGIFSSNMGKTMECKNCGYKW